MSSSGRLSLSRNPMVWLVGEQNPYSRDPRYDLFPEPAGSAGARLCHKILGISDRDYLRLFERRNLVHGTKWSRQEAVSTAMNIATETGMLGETAPVVLLGKRAHDAWTWMIARSEQGTLPGSLLVWTPFRAAAWGLRSFGVAQLPHPSGRSREWNAADAVRRARVAVVQVAPWLRQVICPPEED